MGLRTQKNCKDSAKTQRIDKTGTTRTSQDKGRTEATTIKANKGNYHQKKNIYKNK